jgi:hypothetical protein
MPLRMPLVAETAKKRRPSSRLFDDVEFGILDSETLCMHRSIATERLLTEDVRRQYNQPLKPKHPRWELF